LKAEYQTCT